MASYMKRGKTWQFTVNHYEDGKRKPVVKSGFKTKKEAQLAAQEVELQLKKGNQVILKEIPFSSYFDEWIELYKSNRHKTTYERYRNSLERVKDYFKDLPIQKISRTDYQKFLNAYGKGKSKETVRKLNTHIRSCVKDAIEDGYIANDFTRKAEFHATKAAKKSEDKHLSYEDSIKLYHGLFNKLGSGTTTFHLILLGLVTGARYGELVGLTTDSFDLEENTLSITHSWDYKGGSGFGPLKNEQSERTLSIDSKVMEQFVDLVEESRHHPHGLIFYRPTLIKTVTNKGANDVLRTLLKNLQIDPITMHGLRHTHASVLLYKGANIHSVSKRLGHADIQTTLDHYAHVLKEMEERDEAIAVKIYAS